MRLPAKPSINTETKQKLILSIPQSALSVKIVAYRKGHLYKKANLLSLIKEEVKQTRRILRAIKLDQIDNILKMNIGCEPWNPEKSSNPEI